MYTAQCTTVHILVITVSSRSILITVVAHTVVLYITHGMAVHTCIRVYSKQ